MTVGATQLAAPGRAQAPAIIGVLTDQTGMGASVSGPALVQAVQMAVEDTGPLPDGRPVQVVTASHKARPDDAIAVAQRWFDQGMSVIVDVPGPPPPSRSSLWLGPLNIQRS
jgi:branched-chain amino acid transport system substrate-binding protein